jgi:hypothetical protein
MNRRCIQYRDVKVAPGSDMFAALEAGDTKKAAAIYAQCEAEYARHHPIPPINICAKCWRAYGGGIRCQKCGSIDYL